MKIYEAAQLAEDNPNDPYEIIKALSTRTFPESNLNEILKEINIDLHDVMNPSLRPDKRIYRPKPKTIVAASPYANLTKAVNSNEQEMEYVRTELVNRIPLAFQELICHKRVSFCLANPAVREYSGIPEERKKEKETFQYALERILRDNKIKTHDREVARNIFTYTEVAEYWYPVNISNGKRSSRYGFDTNIRLKCALYSRENGYKFFPLTNSEKDMYCFSMQFQVREYGKLVTYFQAFTDEEIIKYKRIGAWKWEEVERIEHNLGKIPIVFGWQMYPEYRNASHCIKRLEKLISNHGEVNDYHAAPKLLLTDADNVTGVGNKGESGIVLQAKGKDANAKYVTWDNATDSVKLEIDTLLSMIYTLTQTPNINFDNIKGMGAVSGVSIKLLFMDAHLAVKDKEGTLSDFFQRRHSILGTYIGLLEPTLEATADEIEVNTELVPFMIADDKERADIAQIENGGLPTKSWLKTVIEAGGDPAEYELIKKEYNERKLVDISEPTF